MRVLIGTSGYSYKPWKGSFYPEDLPDAEMLRFYAGRFSTVEINNTFYRMPTRSLLERWAEETPEGFRFVLKAPQRITHRERLRASDSLGYFFETASAMGRKLGPVLFQLPPNFKKDGERLRGFLAALPAGRPAAFEFRHESWLDEETFAALREAGAALCAADTDETEATLLATTDWGYLRLRRWDYTDVDLRAWAEKIRGQPWKEAFVFFKHEEEGKGPKLAEALMGDFAKDESEEKR
jgi:uncharacterized protein YecE (DUF72 family)